MAEVNSRGLPVYIRRAAGPGLSAQRGAAPVADALVDDLVEQTIVDLVRVDRFGRLPWKVPVNWLGSGPFGWRVASVDPGSLCVGVGGTGLSLNIDGRGRLQLPLGVRHRTGLEPGARAIILTESERFTIARVDAIRVTLPERLRAVR